MVYMHSSIVREGVDPAMEGGSPLDTTQRADDELAKRLTAREIEVLRLVAEGCDNQTIATRLVLDRATIRTHAATVPTKP
jgi:DNA-binding NarL/FixJ family response regulator